MKRKSIVGTLAMGMLVASGLSLRAEQQCTAESLLSMKDDPNSPIGIKVTLKSSDMKDGVLVRVEMENKGTEPQTLHVCPHTHLCCVKGLHPLLGCNQTGMGLVDFCKAQKPAEHEVFLPVKAAFAFDVTIPIHRMPEDARKAGANLSVLFCCELGDGELVHSNAVQTEMKQKEAGNIEHPLLNGQRHKPG